MTDTDWLVVCLCAEWCGVCGEYRSRFEAVRARFPHVRFVWIDIEDQSDLVDPVEVDDFPTLLVACGNEPRFFGTIRPHPEVLERLLQGQLDAAPPQVPLAINLFALVLRLRSAL